MNLNSFLASKKLLDSDKKSLSREASQKSLNNSRFLNKFKPVEDEDTLLNSSAKVNFKSHMMQQQQPKFKTRLSQFKPEEQQTIRYQRSPKMVEQQSPVRKNSSYTSNIFKQKNYQQSLQIGRQANNQADKTGSLWGDVTNFDNTFNSSRLETKQCIENLSRKALKQLNMLEDVIQSYTKKMKNLLEKEYAKIKDSIFQTVERMFDQYQQNLKKIIDREIKLANQDIYSSKQQIQQMYIRIQKMKQGIESSNWKKIAAEVLSSNLQDQLNEIISKTNKKTNMTSISIQPERKKTQTFEEALENLIDFKIVRFEQRY